MKTTHDWCAENQWANIEIQYSQGQLLSTALPGGYNLPGNGVTWHPPNVVTCHIILVKMKAEAITTYEYITQFFVIRVQKLNMFNLH